MITIDHEALEREFSPMLLPASLGEKGRNALESYDSALLFTKWFLEVASRRPSYQMSREERYQLNLTFVGLLNYYPELRAKLYPDYYLFGE